MGAAYVQRKGDPFYIKTLTRRGGFVKDDKFSPPCENTGRNIEFAVLSALAMLFTVMGHTGVTWATLDWLFPYDAYHMPLFVFISGYFFNTSAVCIHGTKNFLVKQIRHLIIPFFVWNFLYGLVAMAFSSTFGILWCHADEFWYRFLVRPFTVGNVFFGFNAPSWFLLVLFEVKVLNWFFRLLLQRVNNREWVLLITYLVFAGCAVCCAQNLHRTDFLIKATRAFYMLLWLQVGTIYRVLLEKRDTLSSGIYFGIVLTIQSVIWLFCKDRGLFAGIYNSEFTNGPITTILAAFTGIAFSLRIAKILARSIGKSKLVSYVSEHTFSIMMHQFLGFTLLNLLFWWSDSILGIGMFDVSAFQTDVFYRYFPPSLSNLRFFYVVAGFFVPLVGCRMWDYIRHAKRVKI